MRSTAAWLWLLLLTGCSDPVSSPPGVSGKTVDDAADVPFGCRFVDITASSGIDFRHTTGAFGAKYLPETLGSGGALLDADGDGHLDLFLVNSTYWPGHEPQGVPPPTCRLYLGRGDGTFEDVTATSGAGVTLYGMGCAVADYDGDGDDDIYITALGDNVLLRNDGGRFTDVTAQAGVAGGSWSDGRGAHPDWSTACAWLDADQDGDLDLFVAGYVERTPETEIITTMDGTEKVFTTPDRYPELPCYLYRNRGDGTFSSEGESRQLGTGKALGVACWDLDDDGLLDLVVANDTRPNLLFLNQGGGAFLEQGLHLGIAYDESGRARAGMGIDIAEHGNDGVPGIAIGNFSGEPMSFYRRQPDGRFRSVAERVGLGRATHEPLAFGVAFLDLDRDGWQDLVVVNGHIEPDIQRYRPALRYRQSPQLFQGLPGGRFLDRSTSVGEDFQVPRVARALLAGDLDEDGDLDLVITENGGATCVLRNDLLPGGGRHYLRVRLESEGLNRRAIGARVTLRAGGRTQRRFVRTGSSYLSQSELTLTFGLGATTTVDELHVRWPDGRESTHRVVDIDTTVTIQEPSS